MSGAHAHGSAVDSLFVEAESAVHGLAPEAKLVALVGFVVAAALTPRTSVWAFGVYAVAIWLVVFVSHVPVRVVLRRLAVIVPFVIFAVLIPFIGGGEQTQVLGVSLSVDGLWAMWNILAKASIGATASIVLSATTRVPDVLTGLTRLRVPRVLVAIIAFMMRYLDLLVRQLGRMRTSMTARCHDPRWLWQVKPIASSAGALFVRSYERGERVHQAMLARGYTGTMPTLDRRPATAVDWSRAASLPLVAVVTLIVAVVL
ncbi:MAG: cobalt ECF transporter T component CbiQ [Actinomycetota bacterium]|nr:cobalt ECF transporter T component CbiQ [Actinomycetota bacterium]MDA3015623.1 cobalt ECF transporter T component CbiQ [Actinomycetota bacterium]MDA3027488.1 cobalt ECF transporter T component CbiQ [Actinomycetota bacterium]